ncbi:MAG: inositol monophosphatase [Geminicoccaceae bacterium]|nr:inositol monophosphatase [Geminicoccaceae bacterium]
MNERELEARLDAATAIVREAGALALRHFRARERLAIEQKGLQDLVSAADRESEASIRARLTAAFPEDAILGEEQGGTDAPRLWVIDPIDGTANFLKGLPYWCVAMAFVAAGRAQLGLTYDPVHDELFLARRGAGAHRNGTAMRIATRPREAACVGFSHNFKTPAEPYLEAMRRLLEAGVDHRRMGSAALSFAHAADGRLDGAIAFRTNAWDVLGGLLLVEEAGGRSTPFLDGRPLLERRTVIAGTPAVTSLLDGIDGASVP